jgi:hypothetical protein
MLLRIVEAATLVQNGSPPLTRSPISTCCAHYPGGPVQVRLSAASPDRAAFSVLWADRRPQLPFRGLLRLYTRYGPSIRSAAQGGVCRRASIRPVTQPHRLPATGPTDHYPGGTLTHEVIAPFGAHQSHRCRIDALRAQRPIAFSVLLDRRNLRSLRGMSVRANRTPRPLAGEVGAKRRERACATPHAPSPASLRSATSPASGRGVRSRCPRLVAANDCAVCRPTIGGETPSACALRRMPCYEFRSGAAERGQSMRVRPPAARMRAHIADIAWSDGSPICVRYAIQLGTGRFFERRNSGLNSFD